ncbi:MAG: hypothetical protein ACLSAF_21720 [Intestinimonas sp.]
MDIRIRPDLIVKVDGAVQSFANEKGEAVYPIVFEEMTYLPVRSIGGPVRQGSHLDRLQRRGEDIYLYALTDAQRREMRTYLEEGTRLVEKLSTQVDAVVNAGHVSNEEGIARIKAVKEALGGIVALPAPHWSRSWNSGPL